MYSYQGMQNRADPSRYLSKGNGGWRTLDPVLNSTRTQVLSTVYGSVPKEWIVKGSDYTITIHPRTKKLPSIKIWLSGLAVDVDRKIGKDRFSVSSSRMVFSNLTDFEESFPDLVNDLLEGWNG